MFFFSQDTRVVLRLLSASSPNIGSTLVFARTWINQAGVYNPTTGIFTTPCDGVYEFHATLSGGPQMENLFVEFIAGGVAIGRFHVVDDTYWISSSGSAIGRCLKETQVNLRVTSVTSGFSFLEDEFRMSTFSGHLISK